MTPPPFHCKFCGLPSHIDPADQQMPADYCHPEDHGDEDGHAVDRALLLEQIVRDVHALREIELGEIADDGTPGKAFYTERLRRNRAELIGHEDQQS